jgi:regulator of replication initiation timing
MFNTRKQLEAQLDEARLGLRVKEDRINSLDSQRKALVKENADLRTQISDIRDEAGKAMEAKEAERRELCDQLGQLQEQRKKDKATIDRQSNTIGRLIKENMWLCCTNSSLADKLNIKPGGKGRFMKKQTAESNENE